MTTFAEATQAQNLKGKTITTNGMKTRVSSLNSVVDLFFSWGASRNLTKEQRLKNFQRAFSSNPELTTTLSLWGRDIRGGAGERDYFREVLEYITSVDYKLAIAMIPAIVEVGRWDDLFSLVGTPAEPEMLSFYANALKSGNQLAAKWAPREKSSKSHIAYKLRKVLGLEAKDYRKLLSSLTNVVETQMCSSQWDDINFSHVPSQASRIYSKAFQRNTEKYEDYLSALTRGEEGVKVNAGAIYPHEVVASLFNYAQPTKQQLLLMNEQWNALPNFIQENSSVLPMIDVSGSMSCPAGKTSYTCMQVAVALGVYCASKNKGDFADLFLTFSSSPQMLKLPMGDIATKIQSVHTSDWGMSTNIEKAFALILKTAKEGKVEAENMPKTLIIFSDMQFDAATDFSNDAYKNMKKQFKEAGYTTPNIVFWNLNSQKGVPVKADKMGAALVSGFSPSLMKTVLGAETFTPESTMLETLSDPRYKINYDFEVL